MDFLKEDGLTPIACEQLPRLVILTGLNGSGKTRGLKAMAERPDIHSQYIDYVNFKAKWDADTFEKSNGRDSRLFIEERISKFFGVPYGEKANRIDPSCPLFLINSSEEKMAWLSEQSNTCGMARMYQEFLRIFPNASKLPFEQHAEAFNNPSLIHDYWQHVGDSDIQSIFAKHKHKPAHLITQEELTDGVKELFGRKLPLNHHLTNEFHEYLRHLFQSLYQQYLSDVPRQEALNNFLQDHPYPWESLNRLLLDLGEKEKDNGVFQFRLNDNFQAHPKTFDELQRFPQKLSEELLVDIKTGQSRKMDELSSGERTLLALITLLYTHQRVQTRLDELYLDEIDASLHPTMIEAMLDILQKQSGYTRIYLATHSPSTVALAPEESLFFVQDGKARKIGRTEALEGLTQGFLTTEGISSVFRSIRGIDKPFIVISEGKNYEYLEPMFQKVGIAEKCHIHRYKKARANSKGSGELKVLHQLFCDLIDTLPSEKKFVFLIDCEEYDEVAQWDNKGNAHVKAIALKEIKANPQKRGIENVVPAELLDELENELKSKGEKSIYKKPEEPSRGIDRKDRVAQKFVAELNRIDITTLEHTLSDLIALCKQQ